jgi:predicted nucleic acid-binding Zn ribbon protein
MERGTGQVYKNNTGGKVMPIYLFECLNPRCKNREEKLVPVVMAQDEKLLNDKPCSKCGRSDWKKVFMPDNAPSFKGDFKK